jgi:hypothetical protein
LAGKTLVGRTRPKEKILNKKYTVTIEYKFVIFAGDENRAAFIAQDNCLSSSIAHPQTGDVVNASIRVEAAQLPLAPDAEERAGKA